MITKPRITHGKPYLTLRTKRGNVTTHIIPDFVLGEMLAWLNGNAARPAGQRITGILEEMQLLEESYKATHEFLLHEPVPAETKGSPAWTRLRQWEKRLNHLNRSLHRYHFSPWLFSPVLPKRWVVSWGRARSGMSGEEIEFLDVILSFAKAGWLGRLRRCKNCEAWFFAKFRHQEFCSPGCQQKHYRGSDEWKQHRREYMRQYRQQTE